MKYEVLQKEAQNRLESIRTAMNIEKRKIENMQEQMRKFHDIYKNQFVTIAGIGCLTFIFEAVLHHQTKQSLSNYCEMKGFDKDATEFMNLQRERMTLVQAAQKEGLIVDFDPAKDIENFLNGSKQFSPGTISEFFKKIENHKLGEIYEDITKKTSDFFNSKKEEIFKNLKKGANHEHE